MRGIRGIPVLTYHHVNPIGSSVNVTPQNFDRQMKLLKGSGYYTLNTDELLAIIKGNKQIPQKAIMITFDDGWLDNWFFAFPILKKYNLKAVIFVITSLITENCIRKLPDINYSASLPTHKECLDYIKEGNASKVILSWEELKVMENSDLIDIQSHTHTHKKWDKSFANHKAKMNALYEDLRLSKKLIEENLNKKCSALCWPWGIYNKDYVDLAVSLGYKLLFTTERDINIPEINPLRIKRLVIGNISNFTFRKKLFIYSKNWLNKLYFKSF